MKIGILYICTGKYTIFWKDFYLSCEKHFIPGAEKHYYVFTDSKEIDFETENSNIHRIYQENLGWPGNTLRRYEMFLGAKKEIEKMDFLFFFNSNLLFLEEVTAGEFLPQGQQKLVGCQHPGFYGKEIQKFTYESNPLSKAFLDKKNGKYYFAGGINGGEARSFISTMEILDKNIREDARIGITATWHDESHWNCYLNNNIDTVKILSSAYLYPEWSSIPLAPKILIRDKRDYGGYFELRGKFDLKIYLLTIKYKLVRFYKSLLG